MILSTLALALLASTSTATPTAEVDPRERDKVVCKKLKGSGWRVGNGARVCKTNGDWARGQAEVQKGYRDFSRGGSLGSAPPVAGGE